MTLRLCSTEACGTAVDTNRGLYCTRCIKDRANASKREKEREQRYSVEHTDSLEVTDRPDRFVDYLMKIADWRY